jgi:hypothetical protein
MVSLMRGRDYTARRKGLERLTGRIELPQIARPAREEAKVTTRITSSRRSDMTTAGQSLVRPSFPAEIR